MFVARLVFAFFTQGSRFLMGRRPVALKSGTAWRNENKPRKRSWRCRWGSYFKLLRWLLLGFFLSLSLGSFFFLFSSALVYSVLFVNSHSVPLLISCYLSHHISVAQCSLPVCSLSVCLSACLCVSLYLLFSLLPLFLRLWRMLPIVWSVKPLRPVKTPSRSHLASLQVIMKCADMLICTKPTLLMKTQYWLPFIRLIMKYQYHLPS